MVLGATPSHLFPVAVAAMVANGLLNALYNGPMVALAQAVVPAGMQGRVFTLMNSVAQGVYPISLAVVGPVVGWIGIRSWYIGGGVIVFAVCMLALFIPSIAHLEETLSRGEKTPGDDSASA